MFVSLRVERVWFLVDQVGLGRFAGNFNGSERVELDFFQTGPSWGRVLTIVMFVSLSVNQSLINISGQCVPNS